ncbi:MAG: hypothetical protein VYD14_00910 [SAR324 cluster bacterium]|nr:hypothetical protein [SAR324 cluster bacterium]MEC9459749.1 hypothetical protein [SAR324 cluster bacterium]
MLSETLTEVLMFWMKMVTTVIWLIVVNKKKGDAPFLLRSLVINRAIVYTENDSQIFSAY